MTSPDKQTLLDLADRVEAASGPDRELDAQIWLACVPKTARWETRYTHKATGKECVIDETRENGRLIVVPAYTASLDSAMSLVPEEYGSRLWMPSSRQIGDGDRPRVTIWGPTRSYAPRDTEAATPALAYTAAALRAKAATLDEERENG